MLLKYLNIITHSKNINWKLKRAGLMKEKKSIPSMLFCIAECLIIFFQRSLDFHYLCLYFSAIQILLNLLCILKINIINKDITVLIQFCLCHVLYFSV